MLNIAEIWRLCSLRYYFTLSYDVCKERRRRRFYEIPDPPLNFDKIVWPHHLKYKAELQGNEGVTFVDSETHDESDIAGIICDDLAKVTGDLKCELPRTEV